MSWLLLTASACGKIPWTWDDINPECQTTKVDQIECNPVSSWQSHAIIYFSGELINTLRNCEWVADQRIRLDVKNAWNTIKNYALYNLNGSWVFTPNNKELVLHPQDRIWWQIEYNWWTVDWWPVELIFTDVMSGKIIDILTLSDCHYFCTPTFDKECFEVNTNNHCAWAAIFRPQLCQPITFSGELSLSWMEFAKSGWSVAQIIVKIKDAGNNNQIINQFTPYPNNISFTLWVNHYVEFHFGTKAAIPVNENTFVYFNPISNANTWLLPTRSTTTKDNTCDE